jgi:hypothetical protein
MKRIAIVMMMVLAQGAVARSQFRPSYEVVATQEWSFVVDANGLRHIIMEVGGKSWDYPLRSYEVFVASDDSGWSFLGYAIETDLGRPRVYVILGMPPRRLYKGSEMTLRYGNQEVYYRVNSVSSPGVGTMIEYDPR